MMLDRFKELVLNKKSTVPLYKQLCIQIRKMIDEGILPPHLRLPPIRKLAAILEINQITVVSALKQLEQQGYVYSRPGSGNFVAEIQAGTAGPFQETAGPLQRAENPLQEMGNPIYQEKLLQDEIYPHEEISYIQQSHVTLPANAVNFASATHTPDLFPVEDFKQVLNEVLDRDKGFAFDYQESQGYSPLRESIAAVLGKGDIACSPVDLQVISGSQQGIDIVSKSLLNQGDTVITESPTYIGATAVFKSRGANIIDVEIGRDGINMEHLEYQIKKHKPRLIYTIPSFHNPTGCSYSLVKRKTLLELAERYNLYIIEDDYVSDLNFEGPPLIPLKALDGTDRVIFIKSFSKIFMPGLRLGFMIVPSGIHQDVVQAKHSTDISTSGLIQRAFDLYIRRGFWDRHLHHMYHIYQERYQAMTGALDRLMPPDMEYHKPGGGLNIWLKAPYGFPVNILSERAAKKGVIFAPGRIFYSHNTPQSAGCFRLSFAATYLEQIEQGIHTLSEEVKALLGKGKGSERVPLL